MTMWLVGMMGSGKTSVGRLVAARLGLDFYDTDEIVVTRAGRAIAGIWDEEGEWRFRELERDAVHSVPAGVVAAAGGGAVLDADNRQVIQDSPPVVWLRTDPAILAERLARVEDRPILLRADTRLETLLDMERDRETWYRMVASHIIDTDRQSLESLPGQVARLWPV
jgi:shikimate kinase